MSDTEWAYRFDLREPNQGPFSSRERAIEAAKEDRRERLKYTLGGTLPVPTVVLIGHANTTKNGNLEILPQEIVSLVSEKE